MLPYSECAQLIALLALIGEGRLQNNIGFNVISPLPRRLAHRDDRSTWFAIRGRAPICCPGFGSTGGVAKEYKTKLRWGKKIVRSSPEWCRRCSNANAGLKPASGGSHFFNENLQGLHSNSQSENRRFSHTEMTCPSVFSHWKPTFRKPLNVSVESFFDTVLKHAGTNF